MTSSTKKIIKKKRKKSQSQAVLKQDKEKEQQIQLIISLIQSAGVEVRRERLKRGASWSVQGGAAAVYGKPVLFLDRHLSKDDQLDFLIGQFQNELKALGVSLENAKSEEVETLPDSLKTLLAA